MSEQGIIRSRLARSFRFIVSQRLIPQKEGGGRVAAIEILKSTLRTREYLEKGEVEGKTLLEAMIDGDTEGMQYFDGEIEKLVRAGTVDLETGLSYATNPGNLRLQLADMSEDAPHKQIAKPVAQQARVARPLPLAPAGHPACLEKPKAMAMAEPELELEVER